MNPPQHRFILVTHDWLTDCLVGVSGRVQEKKQERLSLLNFYTCLDPDSSFITIWTVVLHPSQLHKHSNKCLNNSTFI